jgi:hypothetical protein
LPSAVGRDPGAVVIYCWSRLARMGLFVVEHRATILGEKFCTGVIPSGITQGQLQAPNGVSLNSAWLGSGKTTAVLLHEADGSGMCGFLFYADFLARHGIRVLLVDLCNHGQSNCLNDPDCRGSWRPGKARCRCGPSRWWGTSCASGCFIGRFCGGNGGTASQTRLNRSFVQFG